MLPAEFTPEQELIVHCARSRPDPSLAPRLRELISGSLDWDELTRTASMHRLLPLVYTNLRDLDLLGSVGDGTRAHLKSLFHTSAQRIGEDVQELFRVLDALARAGVSAIPFKGPTLGVAAYGDLALRPFDDLDLLIAPECLSAASEALTTLGYGPPGVLGRVPASALLRYQSQAAFARVEPVVMVELHWRPVSSYLWVGGPLSVLTEAIRPVSLEGREVPSLRPEALLALTALHGLGHGWERLVWLCDVAELAEAGLDWDAVGGIAGALRCRRVLALGFRLAGDLLGRSLPDGARRILADWPVSDTEISRVAREAFVPRLPGVRGFSGAAREAAVRDSFIDGRRAFLYRLSRPTPEDLASLRPWMPYGFAPVLRFIRTLGGRSAH